MSRALNLFFNIFISSHKKVLYYYTYYLTISSEDNKFNSNLCVTEIAMLCCCFLWGGGGTQLSLKMLNIKILSEALLLLFGIISEWLSR